MNTSRTAYYILTLLLTAGALACIESLESPVLPSSDVQLSIPLVDRIKYATEFAQKDTSLKLTSDGSYVYESQHSFTPVRLDTIELHPQPKTQVTELGAFAVDPPTPLIVLFTYDSLGIPLSPDSVLVPPGTLPTPSRRFGPLADFEYVAFQSGGVSLRIRNAFPFPIQLVSPFVLRNDLSAGPVDTAVVASFSFGGNTLQPNDSAVVSSSLNGLLMRNLLYLRPSSVSTPGSTGWVHLLSTSGLDLEITFTNFSVDSARAKIPAQDVYRIQDSLIVVDDSVSIREALFRSGRMSLQVDNAIDADLSASVGLSELVHKVSGQKFSANLVFTGKGTQSVTIDATQYKLQPLLPPTGIGTSLTFTVAVNTLQSQNFRTLKRTDFVRADFRAQTPLRIERMRGRITPRTVSINSGASGLHAHDLGTKIKGTVSFDSLALSFRLGLSSGFPFDYDLRLVGMNRASVPTRIDSIDIPPPLGGVVKRIVPGSGQQTTIQFGQTQELNSFFSTFFPDLPDSFIVRGSLLLNPPDVFPTPLGEQTIFDTSSASASASMYFPLRFSLTGGELTDTIDIGSNEKFPREFVSRVRQGTIFLQVTNALPFSISFRAALLGNTGTQRDTLLWLPTDGPRTIDPAAIDGNGVVTAPTVSQFAVALNGTEMDQFNRSNTMWYRISVETPQSGARTATLSSSNYVRVKASANIVYTINKP